MYAGDTVRVFDCLLKTSMPKLFFFTEEGSPAHGSEDMPGIAGMPPQQPIELRYYLSRLGTD